MINAVNNSIQGLQKASLNVAKAADNIANPQKGSEVTQDIIDMKVNENHFKANALAIETAQEMHDTLLNSLDIEVYSRPLYVFGESIWP